ncbi:hypothetical protein LSCM1_02773 [Leishmania martiniquensis]|uniref:THIF-type NAD/FAD binding fold domain-containing protein n=1 Tax=Leishmania martiniquensis TaxID=1580590 RepID=A0A836KG54_9TRYP|nr:hypothetical protein LSCM1_02773 [Leishmania martiniquensis]
MPTLDAQPLHDTKRMIGSDVKLAKFDRQLRLWGADGQAALEAAHVVALGATPAIAEALKSLVLTGVQAITLVDERVVSGEDVATNYFVTPTAVGCPLAATVLQHTITLGEQCRAIPVQEYPSEWVANYITAVEEDWTSGYAYCALDGTAASPREAQAGPTMPMSAVQRLVARYALLAASSGPASAGNAVAGDSTHQLLTADAPPAPPSLILVSERYGDLSSTSSLLRTCETRVHPDVPVVLVRSSGFLGLLQTYGRDRVVTRPQNPSQVQMEDLRVFEPFPELQAWFDAHDPDDIAQFPADNVEAMTLHSYLPYPCIVHHAFRRWWAALPEEEKNARQHSPSCSIFPLAAEDYRAISSIVGGMMRRQSPPEEAFVEAMEKCTAKLNRPVIQQLPEGLAELLGDARCADPMRAVRAAQSRVSPVAFMSSSRAAREAATLLVWTSPDVLVWFILQAVQLFVTGKVGSELEAGSRAFTKSFAVRASETGGEEEEDGRAASYTTAMPFQPVCAAYCMPYSGYVPDFTTTTTWYRELQDLYHAKHARDVACIAAKALDLVKEAVLQEEELAHGNEGEEQQRGRAPSTAALMAAKVKPLVQKYSASVVENIWDIRGVIFSAAYRAATEAEWRQRLGQRLVWLTRHISFDVEWNASAQRAACLSVAYFCKEELQRRTVRAAESGLSGSAIAQEAAVLMSHASQSEALLDSEDGDGLALRPSNAPLAPWWYGEGSRELLDQACEEVARWGMAKLCKGGCVQLPSVAASTGALAAQEAVKLLMRIRVPCAHPMLYDGYTNKVFML